MKPMAADTLSGMPVTSSATMPPISANGTLSRISAALRTDWNAWNSSTKIRNTLSGTITRSRAIARCWFSNSPPQTSRAPGASVHARRDPRLHLLDDAAHVAAADEDADRHHARARLAADVHRALPHGDVGDVGERDVRAVGVSTRIWRTVSASAPRLGRQPHDDAEALLALPDLGRVLAAERGLDRVLDVGDVQAVAGGALPIDRDLQLRHLAGAIDERARHARRAPTPRRAPRSRPSAARRRRRRTP